ncbi:MAG: tRNA uridine-5-carboxymethylaminomethyl(34) synthesis GTPase MnmE [Woeseiaceae bacterium]|nr:tRNA uridine-5-carboxymethylaminomethyl(34) synthesis GTPase MnmE [Woeseiaceae bacterium]
MADTDTIAAIATPPGVGGVGIVRVSGPEAENIASKLTGGVPAPRRAVLVKITDSGGAAIDSGLAIHFPAPHSFTGESVLELHGHGGPVVLSMILDAVLGAGARRAEPGEFSRRAFENGKLDLAQAEAVADLIESGSRRAARSALRSLSGAFSDDVHALVEQLTRIRIFVEAAIDFPEEEINFLSDEALSRQLDDGRVAFDQLLDRTRAGRVLRDGFQAVIAGKPNAGKSSLMNALSGDETAIVTDMAGTTRDVLRETIVIEGLTIELVDTAGLREEAGLVEQEGIRRARKAMSSADAVLWVLDSTEPDPGAPEEEEDAALLVVRNKIDLSGEPAGQNADGSIGVSAVTMEGFEALKAALLTLAGLDTGIEGAFSARARHIEAIENARAHFEQGVAALRDARAGELLAEELRLAQDDLGTITGELHSDDLLGRIFADFCIGK